MVISQPKKVIFTQSFPLHVLLTPLNTWKQKLSQSNLPTWRDDLWHAPPHLRKWLYRQLPEAQVKMMISRPRKVRFSQIFCYMQIQMSSFGFKHSIFEEDFNLYLKWEMSSADLVVTIVPSDVTTDPGKKRHGYGCDKRSILYSA